MRTSILTLVAVISLVAFSPAQIKEGDLVLSGSSSAAGCRTLDWNTGKFTTLRTGLTTDSVQMGYGNTYAVATRSGGYVHRYYATGSTSTIARVPSSTVHGSCLDQDSSIVVAGYSTGRVYRVAGSRVTTLSTLSKVYSMSREWKSGEFLAGVYNSQFGQLTRIDRNTGRQSTLIWSTAITHVYAAETIPSANFNYFIGCYRATNGLMVMRRDGSVLVSINIPYVTALTFDERRNRVFVATGSRNMGRIYEVSPQGQVMNVRTFSSSHHWRGIDVWGDQRVSVSTAGTRGTEARVYLRFSESPSANYSVAIAAGMGMTLRVGGQHQHIALDRLFFLSVSGGLPLFTRQFSGTLSSSGSASAYFTLPNGPTRGVPIYVTASAINPSRPGGLDMGNTEVVKIY